MRIGRESSLPAAHDLLERGGDVGTGERDDFGRRIGQPRELVGGRVGAESRSPANRHVRVRSGENVPPRAGANGALREVADDGERERAPSRSTPCGL